MKNITQYLTEDKFSDYENKAAEHIINVLKEYVNVEDPKAIDKYYDYWVRFKSDINKQDIDKIHKELRKVLASHEISVSEKGLSINIFKEPQLSITNNSGDEYVVYFKGHVKTLWDKKYKK